MMVRRAGSRLATIAIIPADMLALLALAALVLQPLLGSLAAASFLLFGLLLAASAPGRSGRELLTWWPLLVLPLYCVASTLWSQFPDITLRYSLQLTATLGIAILIGCRVPANRLLPGLFVVFSVGVALSLLLGRNQDEHAWVGIFASKNAFAWFIVLYAVLSAGVLLDRSAAAIMRGSGAVGLVLSAIMLVRAESSGALASILPTLLIMFAVVFSRRMSPGQMTFALAMLAVAGAGAILVVVTFRDEILDLLLASAGKDTTLTGRTDLWSIGLSLIAERPWLGFGYRAFWVVGYEPAEQLWAMFQQRSGAGFNFHNLYISNTVELGLVGIGMQILVIYIPLAMLLAVAVARPSATIATLLGLQVLMVLGSALEVGVFFEFTLRSILAYVTAIYAARDFAEWRAGATARTARPAALARPA